MKRLAAAALAALLLAAPGCELNPEAEIAAAVAAGEAALEARQAEAAEKAFLRAVARDPQTPAANLGLAKIYDYYLPNNDKAIQYYSRYIDVLALADQLDNESREVKLARARRHALQDIHKGLFEDPQTAIDDILNAIENKDRAALVRRLDLTFLNQLAADRKSAVQFIDDERARFRDRRPKVVYRDVAPAPPAGGLRTAVVCLQVGGGHAAVRLVAATQNARPPKPGPEGFWLLEQIERKP